MVKSRKSEKLIKLRTYHIIIYIHASFQAKIHLNKESRHLQLNLKKIDSVLTGSVTGFNRFLQVVVVWQNLHQEVELKSLRLQHGNKSDRRSIITFKTSPAFSRTG